MNRFEQRKALLVGLAGFAAVVLLLLSSVEANAAARAPLRQDVAGPVQLSIASLLSNTDDISETEDLESGEPVTNSVALAIASYFAVPITDIVAAHTDFGFGEIVRAYFLSRELAADKDSSNNLSAKKILEMRKSGMGWGEIIAKLGLPRGNRDRNVGHIRGNDQRAGKPDKPGKSDAAPGKQKDKSNQGKPDGNPGKGHDKPDKPGKEKPGK